MNIYLQFLFIALITGLIFYASKDLGKPYDIPDEPKQNN